MKTFPIEEIVKVRLLLQSTQRALEKEFKCFSNPLKSEVFLRQYSQWDEKKKTRFLRLVGGKVNEQRTRAYIESLIYQSV